MRSLIGEVSARWSRYKTSIAFALLCSISLSACRQQDTPISDGDIVDGAATVINLEQGWSKQTQDRLWFLTFGSQLLPYQWLLHLETVDGMAKFRGDSNMRRLGFLPQTSTANNPDGLPVGFSKDIDRNGKAWVGLTCAACHTGEIQYQGKRVRLDGGAGMIDFNGFEADLIEALSATAQDDGKFARFAQAVLGPSGKSTDLRTQLVAQTQALAVRQRLNRTAVPYGHGRLDAFGQIFNAAAVTFIDQPGNRMDPNAPVSFPVLWSAPHLDLVQWNGSAPNAGPGPLIQNVTTALAVFGRIDVLGRSGKTGYPSSVKMDNLGEIQKHLYELKSPQWPESVLGSIDQDRASRGKRLYQNHCLQCHQISNRDDAKRKLKATLVKVDEVGTDPQAVNNFLNSRANAGPLVGQKAAILAGDVLTASSPTVDLVVHSAFGAILHHPLKAIHASLQGYHKVYKAAIDKHPNYYKARPLDGIWASSPYLHNGSVPTLFDLLSPAAERPETFWVGHGEYDPVKVGVEARQGSASSRFDTTRQGNANSGHSYGTQLTEPERWDLIEYLKTL